MEQLKHCPFCGEPVSLQVVDECGNFRDEQYWDSPKVSEKGYIIIHNIEDVEEKGKFCPIAQYEEDFDGLGTVIYGSKESAAEAWNRRVTDADC